MIIIKPNCQYLEQEEGKDIEHIVKCASICYGNDPFTTEFKDPLKIYNNLLRQNHISPFRHVTYYYIVPEEKLINHIDFNPTYCNRAYSFETKRLFVSVNGQYYRDNVDMFMMFYQEYQVSKKQYIKEIYEEENAYFQVDALDTLRYTFIITTQISTSRELNRVSPNNICEQSTRYCKFTLPKFGEDVAICQPHWLDICTEHKIFKGINSGEYNDYIEHSSIQIIKAFGGYFVKTDDGNELELGEEYSICINGIPQDNGFTMIYPISFAEAYIKKACDACLLYGEAIKAGVAPQDARGILPVDTATKVVYTYSYKEWQHILDLRLRGTTGKPHPNAKEVMALLEPILEEQMNKDKDEIG